MKDTNLNVYNKDVETLREYGLDEEEIQMLKHYGLMKDKISDLIQKHIEATITKGNNTLILG